MGTVDCYYSCDITISLLQQHPLATRLPSGCSAFRSRPSVPHGRSRDTARVGAWRRKTIAKQQGSSYPPCIDPCWTSLSVRCAIAASPFFVCHGRAKSLFDGRPQRRRLERTDRYLTSVVSNPELVRAVPLRSAGGPAALRPSVRKARYLVDPASSHMLVSKIKPCMSKYKPI